MRRARFLLLAALLLGAAAALIHERDPQERLEEAADVLQGRMEQAREALQAQVGAAAEAGRLAMGGGQALGEGGLRLYESDSVIAWTDRAPISDAALDSTRAPQAYLPDGIYLHAFAARGTRAAHGLRRVWFKPPFENPYLHAHFDAGFALPRGIVAEQGPGLGAVVRDGQGAVMMRLRWADDTALPGPRSLWAALFALAAMACAAGALWYWALALPGAWRPLLLFPPLLLGARAATLSMGGFPGLAGYPLFDPTLFASSFFMPSLGDLLINAAVLLCAALFVNKALARAAPPARPRAGAALALALLLAWARGINAVMIALVHDSSVSLDLFRVQDLNGYSLAALLAIGALLCAWCLLARACIAWLGKTPSPRWMLAAAAAAVCAMAGINHAAGEYDLVLALWPLPVLALLYRMHRRAGAIAVLALVAALALFTAHVLNRQTLKRTAMERAALADMATTREDPVIELLFSEAGRELSQASALAAWLRQQAPCNAIELDHRVRQPFFSGYWDRYDLRVHLITGNGRSLCSTSPDAPASPQSLRDRFEQGVPVGGNDDLRLTDRPGEDALYIGRIALPDAELYVELRPRLVADGLGFPELLLAGDRPASFQPGRFVRARYERGVLAAASGPYIFPINWRKGAEADGMRWTDGGYDLLAKGDAQGALLVLGIRIPTWLDHVTTFSYLFLFYCLLAALGALVPALRHPASPGISGKVRIGVAGFAIISLLLFTLGMRHMVENRRAQRSSHTLDERSRGVLAELRQTLRGEGALKPSMAPYLNHLLGNLSNVFFTDLTLYAPDGTLLATSREQVFNTGLLGPRMDPGAFHRLAAEGASSFLHREHIGSASFSTAYMPFRNEGGKVLAYLALPYFARQGEVDEQRAASYVALVNLFTLLFLLSVVAAALITHWTTRPLELLRRSLERIGLGTRNEPIPYRGNDELSQLVRVYNRKVEDLRESALKLARSERESAWREMAKQVAHEIKNPLTPMKLNIQHFQHTWRPDAPDAKERLDRFSNGLVDQIDVLGRIAGEFSHFAQMPPAHPGMLDLSEVAAAAVQLFANTPGCAVHLATGGPLPVQADREHLLRSFNNLIKNAQQAIPEGRDGRVDVRLFRIGDEAVAEVRDNGTGIPADAIDHVFVPKFTTKGSGMGLGLAMVKRMVENAGGRVWFTTEQGQGTSFFVALPLEKAGGH